MLICREKVNIPADKGFLLLEGDGASQTSIEWSDFVPSSFFSSLLAERGDNNVAETASFTVSAANIVVRGITFKVLTNNLINSPYTSLIGIYTSHV